MRTAKEVRKETKERAAKKNAELFKILMGRIEEEIEEKAKQGCFGATISSSNYENLNTARKELKKLGYHARVKYDDWGNWDLIILWS